MCLWRRNAALAKVLRLNVDAMTPVPARSEDLQSLFHEFEQTSRERAGTRTGLGLAIIGDRH